jgi:hypothetical protein
MSRLIRKSLVQKRYAMYCNVIQDDSISYVYISKIEFIFLNRPVLCGVRLTATAMETQQCAVFVAVLYTVMSLTIMWDTVRSLCRVQILTKIWILLINFHECSPTRISRQSVQLEQQWHMRTLHDYANTPTNCSTSRIPQCSHSRLLLNKQCTHTLPTLNPYSGFRCGFWMTTNIQWRLLRHPLPRQPVVCMVLKATSPPALLL